MNRREKKATAQMNAKSSTDLSFTVLRWGSLSPASVLYGPHSFVRFMRVKQLIRVNHSSFLVHARV